MRKMFFGAAALIVSTFFIVSCGDQGGGNATNKPANAANNAANATAPAADSSAEIKKMMTEIAAALAKNDADAVAKFYADDYHLVTPQGIDQTKAERLADMKSGKSKFESFEYTDINVRSYGDTAVAISTVKAKGVLSGQPSALEVRATLVFRKTNEGWKVVSGQATPVVAATAPPKSDDKKTDTNKAAAPANK